MTAPAPFSEIWRGKFLESVHMGHAVICDASGNIVEAWGDPDQVILPRSSCKMIQALPLIESGAASAAGLTTRHLALSCASHLGAFIHTDLVTNWLDTLGLGEDDLRCGPQEPDDIEARDALIRGHNSPCQIHNNCSGKHSGFLTCNKHIGGGPEYIDPAHPLQISVRDAFEDVTQMDSPGYGIDGCSAPNFATTLHGLARAMAFFATASEGGSRREQAAVALREAMMAHPELVAGESSSCTELMRAMGGKVAVKTGAEGVFIAIVPELRMGIALKVADGATRASECAITALLVRLGVLDANHPAALNRMNAVIRNRRDIDVGRIRPAAALLN